ncbi:MAG: tRNA epoxyqueuosine(34) reductase QueG [Fimbriimonadaceae bacterium]|nr:tRNA epoxyqueuosine(34) reductase QueG [Chthonomonadaceae bacterium]MCO5298025.1 tRNA epoxyqueuosine(34) reductase QueG [Fimbriimonadaceae bacterium]
MGLTSTELKGRALELGFDAAGVCAAQVPPHLEEYARWVGDGLHGTMDYLARHMAWKAHPSALLAGVNSILACAMHYSGPAPREPGRPRIAGYALGRDYHKVLRGKLRAIGRWIDAHAPQARWRVCVDSAPILERDFAQLAGLGWFGKNTCLIDSRRGSRFVLGLLLTTLELEFDAPAVGGCGSCSACIDACPTGAIVPRGDHWGVDARRCISYLTIEHRGPLPSEYPIGDWTFGCDVCQDVCPFNQPRSSQPLRAPAARDPGLRARREWPGLERLAQLPEGEWDALTQGSAVRRAGWEGLKRNARHNLSASKE